jgi:NADH-quinone oxidoreductase subunit C
VTPEQVAAAAQQLLGLPAAAAHATATVDVPRGQWPQAVAAARDGLDLQLFDVLTAVDEDPDGIEVVLRLWSPAGRYALVLRTRCPPEDLRVPTLTGLFGGAAWHERSVHEMFGVVFEGHPDLRPLLLPDGFGAHPLRKDFVLASRTVRPWPGAVEPGQSAQEAAAAAGSARGARRRLRPPGVPAPGSWPAP